VFLKIFLNDYFTNVGEIISKNILKKSYHKLDWKYLNNNCHVDELLFLNQISVDEVQNYLNLLKYMSVHIMNME